MSETETLSGRLRGVAEKFAVIHEEHNRENTDVMVDEEVIFNACCRLDEAADALDAKDALLREAREALRPLSDNPHGSLITRHQRAFAADVVNKIEAQK